MRRAQVEQALRDAAQHLAGRDLFVVGSQAIYASVDEDIDEALIVNSDEIDLLLNQDDPPESRYHQWLFVSEYLGDSSPYHEAHGFYIDALQGGGKVPSLPDGYQQRMIVRTIDWTDPESGTTNTCNVFFLEIHDLLASKLAAFRPKDRHFVELATTRGWADPHIVRQRVQSFTREPDWVAERVQFLDRIEPPTLKPHTIE